MRRASARRRARSCRECQVGCPDLPPSLSFFHSLSLPPPGRFLFFSLVVGRRRCIRRERDGRKRDRWRLYRRLYWIEYSIFSALDRPEDRRPARPEDSTKAAYWPTLPRPPQMFRRRHKPLRPHKGLLRFTDEILPPLLSLSISLSSISLSLPPSLSPFFSLILCLIPHDFFPRRFQRRAL